MYEPVDVCFLYRLKNAIDSKLCIFAMAAAAADHDIQQAATRVSIRGSSTTASKCSSVAPPLTPGYCGSSRLAAGFVYTLRREHALDYSALSASNNSDVS